MSATNSQNDKFAFLFNTAASYDLSAVKTVLNTYYGYQDTIGTVNHVVQCTGCSNFIAAFRAFATNILNAGSASGSIPASGGKFSVMVYITGNADNSGLITTAGSDTLSWVDLRKSLAGIFPNPPGLPVTIGYKGLSEVNVILDSPSTPAFVTEFSGNVPLDSGTLLASGASASLTSTWCGLMKLNTSGLVNSEGMLGMSVVAGQIFTVPTDYANNFRLVGTETEYYAGRPDFLLDDGGALFNSPDIKLEHSAPYNTAAYENCFLTDTGGSYRNLVKVNVKNTGTHPVEAFRVDAALFTTTSSSPGAPGSKSFGPDELAAVLKPGDSGTGKVDTLSFDNPDYLMIAVKVSCQGDDDFSDLAVSAKSDEAQRSLSLIIEPLVCTVTISNATSYGGSEGSIKVDVTDPNGVAPYNYYLDGILKHNGTELTWTFSTLASATYTVKVVDSSSHPRTFESPVYVGQPAAPVTCVPRLDNNWVSICKASTGALNFVLKVYPVPPLGGIYREYKIRWKLTGLNPQIPTHPPVGVHLGNLTVTGTGMERVNGINWGYVLLRIPRLIEGKFSIRSIANPWPFGVNPVIIQTEIYMKSYRWWPFRSSYYLIAKFRLKQDHRDLDVLVP